MRAKPKRIAGSWWAACAVAAVSIVAGAAAGLGADPGPGAQTHAVADTARLVVVDGIVGHEAGGLTRGEAVRTNLVLASRNPVAADLVAAELMGFNPDDMESAELAYRIGRGPRTREEVEVVGADPVEVRRRFKKAGDSYRFLRYPGVRFYAERGQP